MEELLSAPLWRRRSMWHRRGTLEAKRLWLTALQLQEDNGTKASATSLWIPLPHFC